MCVWCTFVLYTFRHVLFVGEFIWCAHVYIMYLKSFCSVCLCGVLVFCDVDVLCTFVLVPPYVQCMYDVLSKFNVWWCYMFTLFIITCLINLVYIFSSLFYTPPEIVKGIKTLDDVKCGTKAGDVYS